ncbi:hypothetical protein N7540_003034 [Penicillium herquei]|nr:hypothetical protein N7540_003034 [Penicillium herquei]
MSSTMPMAAMFTRNRVAFVFSLQGWLGESPEQKKTAATPAYMSVLMSLMALVVYLDLFPSLFASSRKNCSCRGYAIDLNVDATSL